MPSSFLPAPIGDGPPRALADAASRGWVTRVVDVVNNTQRGKLNCTGEVTLAPGLTTTTLIDPRIGPFSCIVLSPLTADAAAVAWWISSRSTGAATIAHPSSVAIDQSFSYAIIG
jgi:hypothetical protein